MKKNVDVRMSGSGMFILHLGYEDYREINPLRVLYLMGAPGGTVVRKDDMKKYIMEHLEKFI